MATAPKKKPRAKPVTEPAPMNIIAAFDDPDLFGKFFTGDSWNGWRAVLKAAFAFPMTESDIEFFKSVAGDRDVPTEAVRELWAVVGRRGGKDSIASAIAAFTAATFTGQAKLRPGEKAVVICLATDREQAKLILNYTRAFFVDVPLLAGHVDPRNRRRIRVKQRCRHPNLDRQLPVRPWSRCPVGDPR